MRRTFAAVMAVMFVGGACSSGEDRPVVFAASSLAVVTDDIDRALEAEGKPAPEWVLTGSQRLVAQVLDGAQPDMIITADIGLLREIADRDLGYALHTVDIQNSLVLAVASGADVFGLEDLSRSELLIGTCAIEVPCGRATTELVAIHNLSIEADTEEPSVRALAAKIEAGELDAGLVYRTDARALGLHIAEDERTSSVVTTYGAALLIEGVDAESLLDDLVTDRLDLFAAAGFLTTDRS